MISDKVWAPHHLERKAILRVRQSSAHQVLHNRESSALQYTARDWLTPLGWSEIEVIDDDLGRSSAGGVQRAGFEQMVAEVCLGKAGAVCAREVSRFARNSRDWQQLIEMRRVVDTVLVDLETVYAPRHGNDACARAQGQPQRVRTGSVAPALVLGPLREGAPGRVGCGGAHRLREDRRPCWNRALVHVADVEGKLAAHDVSTLLPPLLRPRSASWRRTCEPSGQR